VLERKIDGRTDVYSLGCTAFMMLTGRGPFVGQNVAYQQVHAPPPDPRGIVADIPPVLAELVLRCLAKDPDERPATAAILAEQLMGPVPAVPAR